MEDFARMFFSAARYEQWLRFHYLEDVPGKDDAAMIAVPPQDAERSLREEPEFSGLLKALDGREVSLERTRGALAAWTAGACGAEDPEGCMRSLAQDREFLRMMDMHNGWIQEHADAEAEDPASAEGHPAPSFGEWTAAFYEWLAERDAASACAPGSKE